MHGGYRNLSRLIFQTALRGAHSRNTVPHTGTQSGNLEDVSMLNIMLRSAMAVLFAIGFTLSLTHVPQAGQLTQTVIDDGIVRTKSNYTFSETVDRLKQDIATKGIMFFTEIDQSKLASNANVALPPSTLLIFGNPPLGTQFITANPNAGLDWPVRLLVTEDSNGHVWTVYTDFQWIARRHGITTRDAQFRMASKVIDSITLSTTGRP